MQVAVIGAGWAGLAAAVELTRAGHAVTTFEASRQLGGRAKAVSVNLPDGQSVTIDNGQHILIGAYRATFDLMNQVGVDPEAALLRTPLTLKFPDGAGLALPRWVAPLDAFWGITTAPGWSLRDKLSLVLAAAIWQWRGFTCASDVSVADLCASIRPRVIAELIDPLCVSALNTPASRASGQVFLRVLHDSLFGAPGASNLMLPRQDLSSLFPTAAAHWLATHGTPVRMATRVQYLQPAPDLTGWLVNNQAFDCAILATDSVSAARMVGDAALGSEPEVEPAMAATLQRWADLTRALRFEAITTVYAYATAAALPHPMLSLRSNTQVQGGGPAPAQFVFDRGQLGGPRGLLAFVVSASEGERSDLEAAVLAQARLQLGLELEAVQTIVEKRATFACTPGLQRPPVNIAPRLFACGDYCEGPYPATLEGAVRSGIAAAAAVSTISAPKGNST
jgi:hydroxysqualene dehydroxylase